MQTPLTDSVTSFNNILLATDFSSASLAAFQTALGVCTELGTSLLILHVFEYVNAVPPETGGQLLKLESTFESAQSSLDGLFQLARRAGVTCETIMGSDIPSEGILETISSKKIDLAILGTNALHGFERLVFGSTAEVVLRKALCPVLTVGPQASDAVKAAQLDGPVVFATDFHLATTDAIRYAATFCKATRSPLHCLNVLPRTLEAGASGHIIPQIMTEALQQVVTESGITIDPPVCAITYGSEISNAVIEYARQQKAKLIVLGVRQASIVASHLPAHIEQRIHCGLCGTDRVFHREYYVVREFAELSDEGEVLRALRDYTGTIAFGATQELTGDERHHARDAGTGFQYFMGIGLDPYDLCHNLPAGARRHWLLHEIARPINEESVPPEDVNL
jgi:nucleotide-binding universal stress UspA family protein